MSSSSSSLQAKNNNNVDNEKKKHLVLIGGGHAHAQVIKALNYASRPDNLKVTLIDIQKAASYSGMVPGCIARHYTPDQTLLELEPLCDWAGINFIQKKVIDMNFDTNQIIFQDNDDNPSLSFDAVSIDIGSTSKGYLETPGAIEYAIPTRPISKLITRIERAEQEIIDNQNANHNNKIHVVVVGGGAAGIELSMSIAGRWKSLVDQFQVTLLDAGTELLSHESFDCRAALVDTLQQRDIIVRQNIIVQEIKENVIVLQDTQNNDDVQEELQYTHCLWATGAAPQPLAKTLQSRGLSVNEQGWIQVDSTFQSISHSNIFAAGDCCTITKGLEKSSPPKAGVYAVRAGPILIENLTRRVVGDSKTRMIRYKPQDDFLKLLVCGDGTGLGFRFGKAIRGKWVFELKDAIDQMFMNLFKREYLPDLNGNEEKKKLDTAQYDAMQENDPRLEPSDAAQLLERTDDNVDYRMGWKVLRDMTADEEYRNRVLEQMK